MRAAPAATIRRDGLLAGLICLEDIRRVPRDQWPLTPVASRRTTPKKLSTTTPTMQPLQGRLLIDINSSTLEIEIGKIDFYRRITLSAGQKTSVQNIIDGAQNPLEAGLVTLGVIDGTQSAGV